MKGGKKRRIRWSWRRPPENQAVAARERKLGFAKERRRMKDKKRKENKRIEEVGKKKKKRRKK